MSLASEAAVAALMGHMHEVEMRRRLVMIRLKDGETRGAHATAELAVEQKNLEQLGQREESLKHQLRMLSEEHELAGERHKAAFTILKHAQEEEPLLAAHATQQLVQANAAAAMWQNNIAALQTAFKAWTSDSLIAPLRKQLDAQRAEIESLMHEEQLLLQEAAQLNAASVQVLQVAPPSSATNHDAAGGPRELDTARLGRELEESKEALAELTAANIKQKQSWDRETANLKSRIAELQLWISSTEAQTMTIAADVGILRQLTSQGVCRGCS
jgi:hypothetical protein